MKNQCMNLKIIKSVTSFEIKLTQANKNSVSIDRSHAGVLEKKFLKWSIPKGIFVLEEANEL